MGNIIRKLEIDPRILGMAVALVVIWVGFDISSGGLFLTPRNLWNLSVQTAAIAVMACGMVLVIVTRNIDLSVGSMLGLIGMIIGVVQVQWLPPYLGLDHPATWAISVLVAIAVGGALGLLQGILIAYFLIPSFIVTLGGLLIWRGAAWWVTTGQTVAPMDSRFRIIGGGIEGAVGATTTWTIAIVAVMGVVAAAIIQRRRKQSFGFAIRPIWAEAFMVCIVSMGIIAAAWIANSYPLPAVVARRLVENAGGAWPAGGVTIPHGFAVPVLMAVVTGIAITFLARRLRFGRYIFSIGGNPEAAELSGINTRRILMLVYGLMGILTGIAACITTARLNAATNAAGTLDELYVIAAAVIGGTSLSGGVGTIVGAMLGAVVMQSLQSGMVLLGVDTPLQSIVVGIVLVFAVWLDTVYKSKLR